MMVRLIGAVGNEWNGETLFMLDEASALGSLPALEEAMGDAARVSGSCWQFNPIAK
jgi:type IV secretory pathway TraG/TraD family ATPase VirD4